MGPSSRAKQNPSSGNTTSLHFGRVSQIDVSDPENPKVRARLDEMGGVETYWLRCGPIVPDVGTLVAVFLQNEGSGGFAQMAGTGRAKQLRIQMSDSTLIRYENGVLEINGPAQMTTTSDNTDINSAVAVQGSHSINDKDTVVIGGIDTAGHLMVSSGQ